ncbi:MAG: hypothetical protein K9K36_07185 [Desulfarculaceae bacterium]|nr:hypothetical protein [Desulfarculaceae bacterium]
MDVPAYTHVCPLSPDRKLTNPGHCKNLRARAVIDSFMPGRTLCLACDGPTKLPRPIPVEGLAPPPGVGGDKQRGVNW